MLTRKHSIDGKRPLANADDLHDWLGHEGTANLVMLAGDVSLLVDTQGKIVDATADPADFSDLEQWIGQNWLDLVTIESRIKVMELLAAARKRGPQRWRQVNHTSDTGDVPVSYAVVATDHDDRFIAIGRDMRELAEMQQRMLNAQQTLERDYVRLRQYETRYRLLFERLAEPVLVIEGSGLRIREANAAAHSLLGAAEGSLQGSKFSSLFDKTSREQILAFVGAVMATDDLSPISASLAEKTSAVSISGTGFAQDGDQFAIIRLASLESGANLDISQSAIAIEEMPDSFVLAGPDLTIRHANRAFVELVGAASLDQMRTKPLAQFLGRPGIDLEMIEKQIKQYGVARNVNTVAVREGGGEGEPVEVSAIQIGENGAGALGFLIRQIGRRLGDTNAPSEELPRSMDQLSELVGRMSLKEIVRESTDLIEKMCIEAALSYTSNNRASAAEILGLSRQSLYSKLHKFDLANREGEPGDQQG